MDKKIQDILICSTATVLVPKQESPSACLLDLLNLPFPIKKFKLKKKKKKEKMHFARMLPSQ